MKIQVGVDSGSYRFDPVNGKVYLYDLGPLSLDRVLLITNVTQNAIIYDFSNSAKGGNLDGNCLNLVYDTSGMLNTDRLQIFVNVPDLKPQNFVAESTDDENFQNDEMYSLFRKFIIDANLRDVFGDQPLVKDGKLQAEAVNGSDIVVCGILRRPGDEVIINLEGHATATVYSYGMQSYAGVNFNVYSTLDYTSWFAQTGNDVYDYGNSKYAITSAQITQFSVSGLKGLKVVTATSTAATTKIGVIIHASQTPYTHRGIQGCGIATTIVQQGVSPYGLFTHDGGAGSLREFFVEPQYIDARYAYRIGDRVFYQGNWWTFGIEVALSSYNDFKSVYYTYGYAYQENRPCASLVTRSPDGTQPIVDTQLRVKTTSEYSDYSRRLRENQDMQRRLHDKSQLVYSDYRLNSIQNRMLNTANSGSFFSQKAEIEEVI